MTSSARLLPVVASLLLLGAPAFAQAQGQLRRVGSDGPAGQEGSVRVQSNVSLFMAGPTGDGEEAQKLRDRARRLVYEMAARECDLLRDVIAKDCRLESINVNLGRQYGQQQQEGFNVNGAMSMQITLK